jgi:hypothetical protein
VVDNVRGAERREGGTWIDVAIAHCGDGHDNEVETAVPCQLSLVPGKTCGDKEHLGAQVGEAVDESSEDEEQHDQLHNQAEGLRFE